MKIICWVLLISAAPRETNPVKIVAASAIRGYQLFISPAQGPVCNFSPTCSHYAQAAIKKYGIIIGGLMAADRLMRCNPSAYKYFNRYYPEIRDGRLFDPPENNYLGRKRPRSWIRRQYRGP